MPVREEARGETPVAAATTVGSTIAVSALTYGFSAAGQADTPGIALRELLGRQPMQYVWRPNSTYMRELLGLSLM
jgi:hypothetical protein